MRTQIVVGLALLMAGAICARAADWQQVWKSEENGNSVSYDKESFEKISSSDVKVTTRYQFVKQVEASRTVPAHDMTIASFTIDCDDYTSVINNQTWHLNSQTVKTFTGPSPELPAPPQMKIGIPAAFAAVCARLKE